MDDQLLIRFLTHRCSAEELHQIDKWIADNKANADWLFEMERIWSLKDELRFSDQQKIGKAYNRFISEVTMKPTYTLTRQKIFSWSKYTAAVLLILLLSVNLYETYEEKSEIAMNIVEVPKGERVSLTLSDGTKIWLNAETKFSYPSRFTSNREVFIEGEGYFDVTKNKKSPFIVKSDLFKIRVLGTQFNVRAYKDEDAGISLKEGEIQLDTHGGEDPIVLNPNDQVQVMTDGKTLLQQVDMSTVDSWTNGEIAFNGQPLSLIIKTLERKYDIPIILLDNELGSELFHCKAKSGTTLFDVLDLLKETRRMNYTFENNQVLITKK